MKNFFIAFSICIVWSFFALWLYSWILPINKDKAIVTSNDLILSEKLINPTVSVEKAKNEVKTIDSSDTLNTPIKNNFGLSAITASNDIVFRFNEGISFIKNDSLLTIPERLVDYKYKINTYLIEHPENEVHIISRYSATENISTPNMGIQRGNVIKNELITIGVDPKRVVVKSSIEEIDFSEKMSYENAITIEFKPLDKDRIEAIIPDPIKIPDAVTFYPRFSSTGILKNKQLDQMLEKVVSITKQYPEVNLKIIGHTDNLANANENFKMGLTYAEEVRWYFVVKGNIDRSRIKAISRGEVQPIQSNKTASGRKANRRVEIQFEQTNE